MNRVWIITAPGGHILTATASEEKAQQIVDAENEVRPGVYAITPCPVVADSHEWWAFRY